jgi:chromosome partitioning protein
MLLVVGGIKGGSGKTTIATNLAICRALLGKNVWLIDADEQGSTMDWAKQREVNLENLFVDAIHGKNILKRLSNREDNRWWDDIIIDTGGRDTVSQRAALVSCDVFLAPFRPRSLDIWTIPTLKLLNDEIRQVNRKFRAFSVLNQCEPRGSDKESVRKIMEDSGIDCLKGELGYRKAFSDASTFGLGVIELKTADDKSRKEILILHDDIYKGNMLNTYKSHGKDI